MGNSAKPSDEKETLVFPDRSPDGGTEQSGDEAVAGSGKGELSLDSLLAEHGGRIFSSSQEPAALKAVALPELSSAMQGMAGAVCLLMSAKGAEARRGRLFQFFHAGFSAGARFVNRQCHKKGIPA